MKKLLVVVSTFFAAILLIEFIVYPAMTAADTLLNILGVIIILSMGFGAIFLVDYLVTEKEPIKKSKNKKKQNGRN
jgi:hypothetical protein